MKHCNFRGFYPKQNWVWIIDRNLSAMQGKMHECMIDLTAEFSR